METNSLVLAIIVGAVIYGNIGWVINFIYFNMDPKESMVAKFFRGPVGILAVGKDVDKVVAKARGLIWPIMFAATIILWFLWCVFGGLIKKLIGEKIAENPVCPEED